MSNLLSKFAPYRKFIVHVVGAAVIILGRQYGGDSAVYIDAVLLLTAVGLYAAPNDPLPPKSPSSPA